MRARLTSLLAFSAMTVVPAAMAAAQVAAPVPGPQPVLPQVQAPVAMPQQVPLAQQPVAPQPVILPPAVWTIPDANQLLTAIMSSAQEGLDPTDYDSAGLIAAMQTGNPVLFSAAATERFNKLSNDFALGHVGRADRQAWHIPDGDLSAERQDQLLRYALAQHRVGEALQGLLPTHPQYAALKNALQVTPKTEAAKIDRIRLNMDRWRWLPRDLGERYIIVNVPAFTAALVENGTTVSRHVAVAGATKTPTPQLMATATGVTLNPWWEIPKSIEKEVRGKRGYVALRNDKGEVIRWRQPPGPGNALGQIKFTMYNPHNIYLHDTTAKGLFDTKMRAYSHGCIRTEHILQLATRLLTEGGDGTWTPEKVQAAVASRKTVQANFPQPLPVYIVYMSSAALADGSIKDYADIYRKDGKVLAALNDVPVSKTPVAKAADKVASR